MMVVESKLGLVTDLGNPLHPVTEVRMELHLERAMLRRNHEVAEVSKVGDRWASFLCRCGKVFEATPGDQMILESYLEAVKDSNDCRLEAGRLHSLADKREREAKEIWESIE